MSARADIDLGESIAQIICSPSVIHRAVSVNDIPLPLDATGFPAPELESPSVLHQDQLGEPRFLGTKIEDPATGSATLAPTVHDLMLTLSTVTPEKETPHLESTSEHDPGTDSVARAPATESLPISLSAHRSASATLQTTSPLLGSPIAYEPHLDNEVRFTAEITGNQPPPTAEVVALSLADLLQQEAPAESSLAAANDTVLEKPFQQVTRFESDAAPSVNASVPVTNLPHGQVEQQELATEDRSPFLTAAAPSAVSAPHGPERIRKSTPPQTLAEATMITEISTAAADPVSDAAWKSVATPVDEGRRRFTRAEKTVPSEELRMPDLTLGASFTQTDPHPGTPTAATHTDKMDPATDVRLQAQMPNAAPEPVLPAAASTVTATSAGLENQMRFSTAATSTPEANPVERMIAHQVSRAVIRHVGEGDRSLVIRLTPPELGTVRIEFRMQEGRLCAHFQAEDPAVRQALERLLPQLAGDLRQADSPIQQITIGGSTNADQAFDGRGFDGRGGQQAQRQDHHGNSPRQRRGERTQFSLDGAPAPVAIAAPSAPRARALAGLVDTLA